MAHTDPDMTRAYQKGHARKVLRVELMLPFNVPQDDGVREERPAYVLTSHTRRPEIFPENFLREKRLIA